MSEEKPTSAYEVKKTRRETTGQRLSAKAREALRAVAATWVPSRFNISVDLPGNLKAVYNTFAGALAIVPLSVWQQRFAPGTKRPVTGDAIPELLDDLYAKGFFVCEGIDEISLLRQHYLAARHDQAETLGVNILPTLACNLQCLYCFEGQLQSTKKPRTMSEETEKAVVHYLQEEMAGKKHLAVSWFGGEPLLAMGTIRRLSAPLLAACDEAKIRYSSVITTNGVLLTPAVVDQLLEGRIDMVQITVDVPREMKRDKQGRDTLDSVLDNLKTAGDKLQIHVRINLSRDDEAEWDNLFEGMLRRDLHKKLKSINIANVFQPERGRLGCMGSSVANESYLEVLRRQRRKARAAGLPMHTFLSWRTTSGCIATRESSVAIAPDGLLYKCNEDVGWPERAYGSVFSKTRVNLNNLLPWLTYDWFQHEECRDCAALPQCAGGCPHRRLFQGGKLPNDDFCYWFLRGDLEGRIFERAMALLPGATAPA